MPDVAVVGGGIIGATCALELARAGASVTLIERSELAAGASGRNQGWLVAPDDLVNRPLYEPSLERYRAVAVEAPLPVWIDEEPVGHLFVALDGDEPDPAKLIGARAIDRDQLRTIEPGLSFRAERGWVGADGHRLDPAALTVGTALLATFEGASIRRHETARALDVRDGRVRGVITDDGRVQADEVVVAGGPWSASLLDPVGVRIPVRPARGWIVRLVPRAPVARWLIERANGWHAGPEPPILAQSFVDEGVDAIAGPIVNVHPDGSVLVGSSREPVVGPEPAEPGVVRRQVAAAIELIPSLSSAEVHSSWWGIRPMSPDGRPMIGRGMDGLLVATGHGSEGVILGGGTAQLIRALVEGTDPPFDPAPFDPHRFG
jgi:D-hydroxyproline dehydrogenase subunit beta